MNLEFYDHFIALAEEKNFTRAAGRVYISQPALSKSIQKLERELGAVLVIRDRKNIRLTAAGEVLLNYARQMTEIRDEVYYRIQKDPPPSKEKIKIGINRSFTLEKFSDLFSRFSDEYPGPIPDVYELDSIQLKRFLLSGWLDIAIVVSDETGMSDFVHHKIAEDELAAVLPDTPEFRPLTETYRDVIPLHVLKDAPTIRNRRGTNLDLMIQAYFLREGFTPRYICELADMNMAIQTVNSGLAMLFCHHSRTQAQQGLENIHVYRLSPPLTYYHYFCYVPGRRVSRQAKFILNLLTRETNPPLQPHVSPGKTNVDFSP